MSIFRSKASEVIARGEAERGNFEPTGVPKRMYMYWLANTTSLHGKSVRKGRRKENFCHFWRVVAIWAPLMFLKEKAEDFVTSKFGAITSVVLLVAAIVTLSVVFQSFAIVVGIVLGTVLGLASATAGMISAISLAAFDSDEDRLREKWLTKRQALLTMIPGFPVGIPLAIVIKLTRKVKPWVSRNSHNVIIVTGSLVALVFFGGILLNDGLIFLLSVIGLTALGMLAFVGSSFLSMLIVDYISGKRALASDKRELVETDDNGEPVFFDTTPKSPGRISKFFTGLADFLILTFQIVRVKKWKICPTVEIKG